MLLAHPILPPNTLPTKSNTYDLTFPTCSASTVQLGPRSPASRRTHRSQPSAGSAGRHCSTSHIHPAGGAIASPSARSTSSLQNRGGCHSPDGNHVPAPLEEVARSASILHPTTQSARPRPPPKSSLESTTSHSVKLCPRNLVFYRIWYSKSPKSTPVPTG